MVKESFTEGLFTGADNFLTTEFGPFASIFNIMNVLLPVFCLTFWTSPWKLKKYPQTKKINFFEYLWTFKKMFPFLDNKLFSHYLMMAAVED